MAITHGIETSKLRTSVSTPATVASGIHFVVGTAPVHTVDGKVNEVVLLNTHEEAAQLIGYSDDWKKYSLCEEVYTAFSLYGIAPIVVVNVLDPKKHKKSVDGEELTVADNQITLPYETIESSIKITGKTAGEDYGVLYSDGKCIVEFLEDTTGTMTVSHDEVDPSLVTKKEIIGGYDVSTHKSTGFELIENVFPKYTLAPDLLLCPNWSHDSEVAAIMSAKAENINGVFDADAILDIDTTEKGVTYYTDAPEFKKKKNFTKANELVCFPRLRLGETDFNYSTQLAALISQVDNTGEYGGGTPCESASNKPLQADSMVLANGEEVLLDVQKANYLNDNGIITALNFYNGFVSWGNYTAAFPSSSDPVDYFYSISRMFKWVAKTVVLTYWSSIDGKMKRRLIDTILQGVNDWLNGLTSEEKILGGRVEFREDENTETALMAGKARFHVYLTPPSPMQKMEWVFEYDVSYLSVLLAE
jgi:phage tail sheath protein FI